MKRFLLFGALLLLPFLTWGQQGPEIMVEYLDDPEQVKIVTSDGEEITPVLIGDILQTGDTVVSSKSTVELRLDPNGTLIKLAAGTSFTIDSLQGVNGAAENVFSLTLGKLRTVAAKRTGTEQYTFKSQNAVCGVRGTTLTFFADGSVFVEEGLVSLTKLLTGEAIDVAAGFFASVSADIFQAVVPTAAQVSEFLEGLGFQAQGVQDAAAENGDDGTEGTDAPPPPEPPGEQGEKETPDSGTASKGGFLDTLRDLLGMEVGTITIDGSTYQKAVLQPVFRLGKLAAGLYLPIIYRTDLFDPEDWYKPKGNDEWSFGTDDSFAGEPTEVLLRAGDFLSDLALKIRFIEWGDQRDPLFFKVGNISGVTVGHGILMSDYANDGDFPAIRRIGVNLGLDFGGFGFESVVNDLSNPEIFGGRMYVRPAPDVFDFAFGVSGVLDIDPAGEIPMPESGPPVETGDPIFINFATDFDFPILERESLSLILFADAAVFIPYFRSRVAASDIDAGFKFDQLMDANGKLQNYGIAAGAFGSFLIADYRLEYRIYDGTFRPAFYNSTYDRMRGQYVLDLIDTIANPSAGEATMGIYGEAGFSFKDKVRLEAGYMWPWTKSGRSDEDFLHFEAAIMPGVIPVLGLYGSVSYDRTMFMSTIVDGSASGLGLFDANTVLKGEIVYPVAPTLDIAVLISTAIAYDGDGNVIPSDVNPDMPKVSPSFSIVTRIHF